MDSTQLFHYAVDTYIDMLQRIRGRRVVYHCSNIDRRCWRAWLSSWDSSTTIDQALVYSFCQWGMQSWFNDSISIGQQAAVRFNWIFSHKMVQRYHAIDSNGRARIVRKDLKQHYNIVRRSRISEEQRRAWQHGGTIEEQFKQEYLNQPGGLVWCIANTTLYNHRSAACARCQYKNECIQVLQQNYSQLYSLRNDK